MTVADPEICLEEDLVRRWEKWMRAGDFARAWQESDRLGPIVLPKRRIETAAIRCCRGFGDAIQFLRFAPLLKQRVEELAVYCPSRLIPLLELMPGIDRCGPLEANAGQEDWEIECSDLPYLFRVTLEEIPKTVPYLKVSAKAKLPVSSEQFKIGIAWAGGEWNPSRFMPVRLLATLSQIAGVALFSLQRGPRVQEAQELFAEGILLDGEANCRSIIDTAAVISSLDLIITVDTMIAHLAGALGKPVWTLLTHVADWRWMEHRSDSPWYPSMRLFRQARPGDWESVIDVVKAELKVRDQQQ